MSDVGAGDEITSSTGLRTVMQIFTRARAPVDVHGSSSNKRVVSLASPLRQQARARTRTTVSGDSLDSESVEDEFDGEDDDDDDDEGALPRHGYGHIGTGHQRGHGHKRKRSAQNRQRDLAASHNSDSVHALVGRLIATIESDRSKNKGSASAAAGQLYAALTASCPLHQLSPRHASALLALLTQPPTRTTSALRPLALLLLSHHMPRSIHVDQLRSFDKECAPDLLRLVQSQTQGAEASSNQIPSVITYIYDRDETSGSILTFLASTATYHPSALEPDQATQVCEAMAIALTKTENALPSKKGGSSRFSSSGKKVSPYTELDGTEARGIFTPLCLGKAYGGDHLLSISSFSVANAWLRALFISSSSVHMQSEAFSANANADATMLDRLNELDHTYLKHGVDDETLDTTAANTTAPLNASTSNSAPRDHEPSGETESAVNVTSDVLASESALDSMSASFVKSDSPASVNTSQAMPHVTASVSADMPFLESIRRTGVGRLTLHNHAASTGFHALDETASTASGSLHDFSQEATEALLKQILQILAQFTQPLTHEKKQSLIASGDYSLRESVAKQALDTLTSLAFINTDILTQARGGFDMLLRMLTTRKAELLECPHVVLSLFRLFLHFSDEIAFDIKLIHSAFFEDVLPSHYSNALFCADVVNFLMNNRKLLMKRGLLAEYFPSLLYIVAWHPRTFTGQFMALIPLMSSPSCFVELLHRIFDLPVLTSALIQLKLAGGLDALVENTPVDIAPQLYSHILTPKGGLGGTIDKLGVLHKVTEKWKTHTLVLEAAKVAPFFAKIVLDLVLKHASAHATQGLVEMLIERVTVLFDIPSFQTEVRAMMAEYVLRVFQRHPSLVVEQQDNLLAFIQDRSNASGGKEEFFLHIVWIIGEHVSPVSDPRCTTTLMLHYHEVLQIFAYEIHAMLQSRGSASSVEMQVMHQTRLLNVLMTAMAKLAVRCPEILALVILLLTKIARSHLSSDVVDTRKSKSVLARVLLLLNILKTPSVGAALFSEPPPVITDVVSSVVSHSAPSGPLSLLRAGEAFVPPAPPSSATETPQGEADKAH